MQDKSEETKELEESLKAFGVTLHSMSEIVKLVFKFYHFALTTSKGKKYPHKIIPSNPSDISSITYTSGSTGKPKGAIVADGNMNHQISFRYCIVLEFSIYFYLLLAIHFVMYS